MKNLFTVLLFMAMVVGYMSVGFAENAYNSIEEIKLDGEEAIGKTATLELEFLTIGDLTYQFIDSGYKGIFFEKDAKFKKIIKKIIKAKAEGEAKARSSFNYSDLHIKYFITFKIVGFESGFVIGKIIKINDSANEPMK